jgi:hypothetical protein
MARQHDPRLTVLYRPDQGRPPDRRADKDREVLVSEKPVFDRVAPVIPVLDLDAALERYHMLGFTARAYDGNERYGFVDRDGVALHLSEWDEHDPTRTAAVVYLYVSDADAVHAEWAAIGIAGRLGEPHDTEYGLREFGYVDPDGTLHRVGSPIDKR